VPPRTAANFTGKKEDIHCGKYRLPEDAFQFFWPVVVEIMATRSEWWMFEDTQDLNKRGLDGQIPLIKLALWRDPWTIPNAVKGITSLIQRGADPNIVDRNQTPLTAAVNKSHSYDQSIVKVLLENGANVNWAEGYFTPLMLAVMHSDANMVKLLLDWGADPNLVTVEGGPNPPLHWACRWGVIDKIELLIKAGASFVLRDYDGKTPADRLIEYKNDYGDEAHEKVMEKIRTEMPAWLRERASRRRERAVEAWAFRRTPSGREVIRRTRSSRKNRRNLTRKA